MQPPTHHELATVHDKDLQHRKVRIAALPLINACLEKLQVRKHLEEALGNARYARAVEVLIKSVLLEPAALYRIPAWAEQFDLDDIGAGRLKDDVLGRALDRLFRAQRATLQTKITVTAIQRFSIDVSELHCDSTSVKVCGVYRGQSKKAIQLKLGHSKDHRPDLKQLLYNLTVARDGSIPIHFKAHDGNKTDDTLHVENWLTLRGIVGCSNFLYVADSKLCTTSNMMRIDREQGRFVTIVPNTRAETKTFADECYEAGVRWRPLTRRPSTRVRGLYDLFSLASEPYQMEEGFRLYWYRSSEKRKRDAASRKERLALVMQKLADLNTKKTRGRRTARSLLRQANRIVERYHASAWLKIEVTHREEESFTKTSRGKPSPESTYRRKVRRIPQLVVRKDHEQIARSKAVDGVFPLTTNTQLSAKEVLAAYKYQPYIEKRFAGIKSDLQVAPVFLKNNERIEALLLVVYIADLVAALIQRDLRLAMRRNRVHTLHILPEERPTHTPTWEQMQRLFANHCKFELWRGERLVRTFWDDLSEQQQQVLHLLSIPQRSFAANN
jgi:transposase